MFSRRGSERSDRERTAGRATVGNAERATERKQILEMLAQGKITAEDADRLLERLELVNGDRDRQEKSGDEPRDTQQKRPRFLRVQVNGGSGDNVNIRIPLFFVRAGIRLSAVMPSEARKKLEERGVDLGGLSDLQGDDLVDALRDLTIDINDSDGDTVRVFCE